MHPTQPCILGLLLGCALQAQGDAAHHWRDLPLRRAEIKSPQEEGPGGSRSAGKVVELKIGGGRRVPLLRPVSDWQIAELPGQVYVILAGGIRESLDLYLYEAKTGSIEVIGTDGGRLLPREFGEDQGSWPRFEGRALVFFPYERNDRLYFTVVNFAGQLLTRRILPLSVDAYRVEIDALSYEVRVSFESQSETLTFLHPTAPRLVLDAGQLSFPSPERRSFILRNEGQRPLRIDFDLEGKGFRIVGPERAVIPASSSREITVEMSKFADARASLSISSPVPGAEAVVGLQNLNAIEVAAQPLQALAEPEIAQVEAAPSRPAEAGADSARELPAGTIPCQAPLPPVLTAAECLGFEVRRKDGERVEVSGRPGYVDGHSDPPEMLLQNCRTGEVKVGAVGMDGWFRITIAAAAGDDLQCACAVSGGEASYKACGPILPTLTLEGAALIAVARAGADLLLLEVLQSGASPQPSRVLRSWRMTADGQGRVRIPVGSLGGCGRSFMLLSPSTGGFVSQTQVVTLAGELTQRR